MIISASRRTDIPAFYSKWFMNRIRAGYCLVPNPRNMKQVSRVSLQPHDTEAIVFWSKNPAPMLPHLAELDKLGFYYYFQFSLNDYPRALEPNIPSLNDRIETFKTLSQQIGPLRVVWRYDPIIISNITSFDFHRERFTWIAEELKGATHRVMVSIVDFYQKTERRLSQLETEEGYSFDRHVLSSVGITNLLRDFGDIARKNDIEIFTCAEEGDYSQVGVPPGRCVDERLLAKIWSLNLKYKKDPSQRDSCLCMVSKDIGMNNTCMHGCPYCYATVNYSVAQRRYNEHDPHSPLLWGNPNKIPEIPEKVNPQMKLL
ncbi:hypothetical protein ES708_25429 [subsurface metagenome]